MLKCLNAFVYTGFNAFIYTDLNAFVYTGLNAFVYTGLREAPPKKIPKAFGHCPFGGGQQMANKIII